MIALVGAVQRYAWGSPTAIPAALGLPADGDPWAELWWGTHPGGRTLAVVDGEAPVPLADLAGHLPFLVKLLAAQRPLSLQVHPTAEQARTGYEREERLGIPVGAPHRNYRDPHAKPEMLVALTEFDALCGFRPVDESAPELERAGAAAVAERLRSHGPAATVAWLLEERPTVAVDLPLVRRLDALHPGDPGAVVAALLRRVRLSPGQALFLEAGVLHMYLHGVGLEVMGASDNVLRGGLTAKHVDVEELLRVLDPQPTPPVVLRPGPEGWYPATTEAFAVQALGRPGRWRSARAEILVRLAGDGGTRAWYVPAGSDAEWPGGLGARVTVPSA